jgi:hypothetical protein
VRVEEHLNGAPCSGWMVGGFLGKFVPFPQDATIYESVQDAFEDWYFQSNADYFVLHVVPESQWPEKPKVEPKAAAGRSLITSCSGSSTFTIGTRP